MQDNCNLIGIWFRWLESVHKMLIFSVFMWNWSKNELIFADFVVIFELFEILELFEYLEANYSIFEVELLLLESETLIRTITNYCNWNRPLKSTQKQGISWFMILQRNTTMAVRKTVSMLWWKWISNLCDWNFCARRIFLQTLCSHLIFIAY